MTFIPLVVGVLALLLVVLFRRTRTASTDTRSSTYGGDTWTPMLWTDADSDPPCHSTDTADCGGGDTGCDAGGSGCD